MTAETTNQTQSGESTAPQASVATNGHEQSPSEQQDGTQQPKPSAEARELERQLEEARTKLRDAEQRAQDNLDRWQRAQADLANFRRRSQFDREEQEKFAVASLVSALLPVLDSFDRAWQSLPGQLRRLTWLSGIAMIESQLRGTLQRIGLSEIDADGQPFDPAQHEAIDSDPHEGPPHVVQVLQPGYKLFDRVIRPALVKVGAKPAASEPDTYLPPADSGATTEEHHDA